MANDVAVDGLIALDWGSSRLRAWRLDPDGAIDARRERDDGAIGLSASGFDAVLVRTVGDWAAAHPRAPLLACGMVGARGAWVEAPYVAVPAGIDAIRSHLVRIGTSLGRPLSVVGGLRSDAPDVLRGEETQALGTGLADGVLCMPGTHAKWLRLRAGVVESFATWFTGELYELLGSHGSLAKAFGEPGAIDEAAFDAGVVQAAAPDADARWLHALFGFRARVVGQGSPGQVERSRLSGWLLGTELRQALRSPVCDGVGAATPLVLVGDPRLSALYGRALAGVHAGLSPELAARTPTRCMRADPECAAHGLYRIATGT